MRRGTDEKQTELTASYGARDALLQSFARNRPERFGADRNTISSTVASPGTENEISDTEGRAGKPAGG